MLTGIANSGSARTNHIVKGDATAAAVALIMSTQISITLARGTRRRIGQWVACASGRVTGGSGIARSGRTRANDVVKVHTAAVPVAVVERALGCVRFTRRIRGCVGCIFAGSICRIADLTAVAGIGWTRARHIAGMDATTCTVALIRRTQVAIKLATRTCRRIGQCIACPCGRVTGCSGIARPCGSRTHHVVERNANSAAIAVIDGALSAVGLTRSAERCIRLILA